MKKYYFSCLYTFLNVNTVTRDVSNNAYESEPRDALK